MVENTQEQKDERKQLQLLVGVLVILGSVACMAITTVYIKFMQGKTWDNVSVRCGLMLAKAAMIVDGHLGPLVYVCFILILYNFALMVNKRRDSQPGATLPLQIFFCLFMMHVGFIRSGHRERMSSVQVGRVCPGGSQNCSEAVHTVLLMFDIAAPYLIGHLCLPLVVKARVQYAYAHLSSEDSQGIEMHQAHKASRGKVDEAIEEERTSEGGQKIKAQSEKPVN